jgi:hypothetical protein
LELFKTCTSFKTFDHLEPLDYSEQLII